MAKALPKEIQKQVDALDAMYQQPEADDTAAQAAQAQAQDDTHVEDHQAAPTEDDAGAESKQAEQPVEAKQSDTSAEETWEQRYKTLQGMHNQNMSDIKRRLKEAQEANEALQKQMAEFTAKQADEPVQIDPKFADEFGADLVGMVQSIVQTYLDKTQAANESRIKQLDDRVKTAAHAAAKTSEELFYEQLAMQVPEWKKINVDHNFLAWLSEDDPVYGWSRQQALDDAARQRDVGRVARIFKAFTDGGQPQPEPKPSVAKTQLEKQVAPPAGRASPPATAAPRSKRTITSDEVTKFYDDVRRGLYRGREEDMQREEQEINRALAEGRITA